MTGSAPLSRVQNSQPEGIGRLVRLGDRCAWNNLGRNVVFADARLRPLAIFGDTMFPDDDEASQFDLDIHAIVELAGTGQVAVLNHLGAVRIFEPFAPGAPVRVVGPDLSEVSRLEFVDDLERVVCLGDRLVTSRPRGQRLDGVMVSGPIGAAHHQLGWSTAQEPVGFVTALAASSTPDGTGWVALGGEGWARLVEARHGRLGPTRWEAEVDFCCSALVASGPYLWAAGSALGAAGVDDYDWAQLGGGGLAQLDLSTGAAVASAHFGGDLAWGSGGAALVVADGVPYGVGRLGELHALPPGAGVTTRVTDGLAPGPQGIAHAAVVGDQLVIGFNRGGYRLHVVPLGTLSRLVGGLPARRG